MVAESRFTCTIVRSGEEVFPLDEMKVGSLHWMVSIGDVSIISSRVFPASFVNLYPQRVDRALKSVLWSVAFPNTSNRGTFVGGSV